MLSKLSTGYPVDSGALLMVSQKQEQPFFGVRLPLCVNHVIVVLFLDLLIYLIDLLMSLL